MERQGIFRVEWGSTGRCIAVFTTIAILSLDAAADAQTRTARDTATTYGARLNAKGEPADLNPNRINNRVNSRLETRLSLRIERYRPDSIADTAAAFAVQATDNSRIGTEATLSPLSTSTPSSISQAFEAKSQTVLGSSNDAARPR